MNLDDFDDSAVMNQVRDRRTGNRQRPDDSNYPKQPGNNNGKFDFEYWMKTARKTDPVDEDAYQVPEPGDSVRTNKMKMDGRCERVEGNIVYFRLEDGRLMKSPMDNVSVVQKLADEERLAQEGTMGGINRSAPAQDVSYEDVLDEVNSKWGELNELSIDKMRAYKDAAKSNNSVQTRPLMKLAKSVQGVARAGQKIRTKSGQVVPRNIDRGTYESRLAEFLNVDEDRKKKNVQPGATKDISYKGWNLRYQVKPRQGSTEFEGMAVHAKSAAMDPIESKGGSAEDVVNDMKSQIDDYRGKTQINSAYVIVDFNADIAQNIIGHGDEIYAEIMNYNGGPVLLLSPQDAGGMKRAVDRSPTSQRSAGKIGQQAFKMSGKDAIAAGLTHARYTLDKGFDYTDGVVGYPLKFSSEVYPGEVIRLGEPGVTIAYPRK